MKTAQIDAMKFNFPDSTISMTLTSHFLHNLKFVGPVGPSLSLEKRSQK